MLMIQSHFPIWNNHIYRSLNNFFNRILSWRRTTFNGFIVGFFPGLCFLTICRWETLEWSWHQRFRHFSSRGEFCSRWSITLFIEVIQIQSKKKIKSYFQILEVTYTSPLYGNYYCCCCLWVGAHLILFIEKKKVPHTHYILKEILSWSKKQVLHQRNLNKMSNQSDAITKKFFIIKYTLPKPS